MACRVREVIGVKWRLVHVLVHVGSLRGCGTARCLLRFVGTCPTNQLQKGCHVFGRQVAIACSHRNALMASGHLDVLRRCSDHREP
jgi:hypothetical protein